MSELVAAAEVVKGGVTVIHTGIYRSLIKFPQGIMINVKAVKGVENFMEMLGSGRQIDVDVSGRHWRALQGETLKVYELTTPIAAEGSKHEVDFRLDRVGYPLIDDTDLANLSFLRLVGISEGAGVWFGLKCVLSLDEMRDIRDKLAKVERQFYINYMRPVDLSIQISTGELQL